MTEKQTVTGRRLYCPSDLDELYSRLPGAGRRVKIEYVQKADESALLSKKPRNRMALVVQKVKHEDGAHITVQTAPEQRRSRRGTYRMTFLLIDILLGKVKITEVS